MLRILPPATHPLIEAPQTVTGFHGCSREVAARICQAEAWVPSENDYDWLGRGIYFWEYAPYRALEWAEARFGDRAAVVQAVVMLGRCLNLLDRRHFAGLEVVYQALVSRYADAGIHVPMNTTRGAHYLDRAVVDDYCDLVADTALPFQTVRGCFPEGGSVYSGSKILRKAHVQVAVRDPGCIRAVRLVRFE